ncbi:MAG: O-antigen ligase family protein [Pseudomonadota bacterium]
MSTSSSYISVGKRAAPSGLSPDQAQPKASGFFIALLLLAALAFSLQPLGIRPMGIPVALALITVFNAVWFILAFRAPMGTFLPMAFFPIFLILGDILIGFGTRGIILALLMTFAMFGAGLQLSTRQISRIWSVLAWVCFLLAVLGLYRYLNGYVAPFSQNETGIADLEEAYFYLGISYLPATRNSEAFYFVVGLVAALYLSMRRGPLRYAYIAMALFQAVIIGLTLSRGAYVAALAGAYLLLDPGQRVRAGVFLAAVVALGFAVLAAAPQLLAGPLGFVFILMQTAVVSLFDSVGANQDVAGFYTYSNDVRLDLYIETVQSFLSHPFGQGMDNVHYGTPGTHTKLLHSENIYLDFLIIFGLFGAVLFTKAVQIFGVALRLRKVSREAMMGLAVIAVCGLFAMFNSPVNLVIFWFVLGLGLATLNHARLRHQLGRSEA